MYVNWIGLAQKSETNCKIQLNSLIYKKKYQLYGEEFVLEQLKCLKISPAFLCVKFEGFSSRCSHCCG